jgi:type II secretory pathway pseudopilin PulG
MCAIIILGIALVGLIQGITTAVSSSKESELQTTAALIAAGKIEMLRADGYVLDGITEGESGEGLSPFRWRRSVTSTSVDGLHDVSVVVEDSKSGTTIYELRTLLFDPPSYSSSDGSNDRKDSLKSRRRERNK